MLYHKPLMCMKPNGGASGASRQKSGARGVKESEGLQKAVKILQQTVKTGIINSGALQGIRNYSEEEREKLFAAIDKACPAIEGLKVRDVGLSREAKAAGVKSNHYRITETLPDGTKYSTDHPYPYANTIGATNSEAERNATVRLTQYRIMGLVREPDGRVFRPEGYYSSRDHYMNAVAKGWDIPPGVHEYYRQPERRISVSELSRRLDNTRRFTE